ncbi:MAG: carboxypeptidase regulatory-like domain-containing protein [candidate division Zixibacteria bacterium]|nr:carboxypeptidase regulatory-like domain-containing protein [candidate division Zixibacteria bacterium]
MKRFVSAYLFTFSLILAGLSFAQADDCPGLFTHYTTYVVNSKPISIFSEDLNGDGHKDIAVACHFREFMSVTLNNGDGTFTDFDWSYVPYYTEWLDGADLDGDDDIDIVTANSQHGNVAVLLNNGDATFAMRQLYTTYGNPRSVCLAKIDDDDDIDIVTANYWTGRVSILFNNGDGTFASYVDYVVNGDPRAVYAADLDGDGDNDLITANMDSSTVTVLRNNGLGEFTIRGIHPTGPEPFMVQAAALDDDELLDLVTVNTGNNTVSVLLNTGYGATFGSPTGFDVGVEPVYVTTFDVDKDGDLDLATSNSGDSTVSVLLNDGNADFDHRTSYSVGVNPYSIAVADFDNDNDLDLGIALFMSNYVSILDNIDAVPFTGIVSGSITNNLAEPVQGARVFASESQVDDTSQANGDYTLSDVCAATQDIHFTHPDFCDTVVEGIRVPAFDIYNIDMVLNYRSIYGLIIDPDSIPIEGVYVEVSGADFSDSSNSTGEYHLGGLGPGPHDISFFHPHFGDTSITDVAAPLNDTTIIDLQMQPRGFIKGRVTDQSALPLEYIFVEAIGASVDDSTDEDGNYLLNYLNAGTCNIRFSNTYYYNITLADISVLPGDTTTVDITLIRRPDIELWYGTVFCDPIIGMIDSQLGIDLYLQTAGDIQIQSAGFILAADESYINSLVGESMGEFFYPFTAMDQAGFSPPLGSPPNQSGWTSQAFSAQTSIEQSPWFNFDSPMLVARFVVEVVDDTSIVGDTVSCLSGGVNELGDSSSVFTFEDIPLTLTEHFCQLAITDGYPYLPGDVNMFNGAWPPVIIGGDVTYLVNYFRLLPSSQPCLLDGFWASADANGDCLVIGSDVTRLVNFFRSLGEIVYCPDYTPLWPSPDDIPTIAPINWPNCDIAR